MTCVFDGAELVAPVLLAPPRGVRVLFSKPGVTADELIRQLVRAEPPGRPVIVVSTDREVADEWRARAHARWRPWCSSSGFPSPSLTSVPTAT